MTNENKFNINTLRMIRIVKNIKISQMSKYFDICNAHACGLENDTRTISQEKLEYGLNNLKISIEAYNELEEFRKILLEKQIKDKEKFKYMLMKTIGVLTPAVKSQIDEVLNNVLFIKTK